MDYTALKRENNLKKNQKLNWFEFAIIVFFSAYYILPSFSGMFPFILVLTAKIAYMLYVCLIQPKRSGYMVLCFLIFAYIGIIYALLTDSSSISATVSNYELKSAFSKFNQYFNMFFPAFITFRLAECTDTKKKKWLMAVISILLIYVIFVTIREIEINPDITRTWAGFDEASESNIASYYFVYAIPILIGLFIICFNKCKSVLLKITLVGAIIYSFYFLLKAQYTLSLLIAVIGLSLGFIKSTSSNITRFIVVAAAAVVLVFAGDILNFIASNVESRQMATRLNELAAFFTSGDATGYNLSGRLDLYWRSIKAFFTSPIWGNRSLDFDGHATFFTVLSDTGILGGVAVYYLYLSMRKHIVDAIGDTEKLFAVPFIMLVLMGFTNPIHAAYPVGFTLWFVVPLIIMIISESQKSDLRGVEDEQVEN